MKRTRESLRRNPNILANAKRRAALAAAAAPLVLSVACATSTEAPTTAASTTEINEAETPQQQIDSIANGLTQSKIIQGVKIASDYNLLYPNRDLAAHPDGISNPFILGDNIYGYVVYNNETGKAQGVVAPTGATLTEDFPADAHIPKSSQPTDPHIANVDVSSVYYESSSYGPAGRYYVTAIGEQPGFVSQTHELDRAGDAIQVGK